MPTQSENTKRIAKNTMMLYARMLFRIGLNFSSETMNIVKWVIKTTELSVITDKNMGVFVGYKRKSCIFANKYEMYDQF